MGYHRQPRRRHVSSADRKPKSSWWCQPGCSGAHLGATVLELVVPLVLISKWARRVVPIGLLIFHVVNIVWLRIAFIEDMLMLVLFSNIWFPALGRRLTDLEKRLRALLLSRTPNRCRSTT